MTTRAGQPTPSLTRTRSGSSPATAPQLFFTPAELARRWRVTQDHLYRQVIGRELPAIRIGNGRRGRWRIAYADIEKYETRHRVVYAEPDRMEDSD